MTDVTLLHPGDPFPEFTVALPGGQSLQLPGALGDRFGVVLFYRGPYCNAQLSAYQRSLDGLADLGVSVVALSVDGEATTQNLIAKHGLQFPVGHSADADAVASLTGAFVNPDPRYLQATGFVLDPGGRVVVSVYSSGAIGRLIPQDVMGLVRYLREHARPASQPRLPRFCDPGEPDPAVTVRQAPAQDANTAWELGWRLRFPLYRCPGKDGADGCCAHPRVGRFPSDCPHPGPGNCSAAASADSRAVQRSGLVGPCHQACPLR